MLKGYSIGAIVRWGCIVVIGIVRETYCNAAAADRSTEKGRGLAAKGVRS